LVILFSIIFFGHSSDGSAICCGMLRMCVFHNSDTILLIYSFIHSLYSFIMRTRSKNRLRDGAAGDAADAALAEASFDLPPTNNPSNAALGVPSLQALADPPLGSGELKVPAYDYDGAALADPNAVALLDAPPAHNNAGVALGDRDDLDIGGLKANDDAEGAVEDDSIASEVEFDWQPVSV
jgi:hypothetical protein